MPGWFSRLTSRVGTIPEAPASPYALTCCCGVEYQGLRRIRYQQIICRECGEPLFVLPNNVYPAPRAAASVSKPDAADGTVTQADRHVVRDETAKPAGRSSPRRRSRGKRDAEPRPSRRRRTAGSAAAQPVEQTSAAAKPGEQAPVTPNAAISRGRLLSPFRLIVIVVVLVIGLTVTVQVRKRRFDAAELVVRSAVENGHEAVRTGRFVEAEREFGRAAEALNVLGRTDASAIAVDRWFRESQVVNNLSNAVLPDVLLDAERARQSGDIDWKIGVMHDVASSWSVLDTRVTRSAGGPGGLKFVVEFPLTFRGGKRVEVSCVGGEFERLGEGTDPGRVIFAARVQSIDLDVDGNRWMVALEPDSVVVLTSPVHATAIGFDVNESAAEQSVLEILQRQAQALGVNSE